LFGRTLVYWQWVHLQLIIAVEKTAMPPAIKVTMATAHDTLPGIPPPPPPTFTFPSPPQCVCVWLWVRVIDGRRAFRV